MSYAIHGEWLHQQTGRYGHWWMHFVQEAIKRASAPNACDCTVPAGEHTVTCASQHDTTDPHKWMKDLTEEVIKTADPTSVHDENMRTAAITGLILSLWYSQVQRAKVMDPARPVSLRMRAWQRRREWWQSLMDACFDDSHSASYFPGQQWESPFDPGAANGKFV